MSRSSIFGCSAWLFLFASLLLGASSAWAQADPSIRDWGSPPGTPPPWQTADVWVDNDGNGTGNEVGEPSKGLANRLFARVRNMGSSPANNVTVRFHFAPYGLWSPASWGNFKEIMVVTGVNLGPAGSPTAEQLIEVPWDLSNLSESNGGAWGGHTVSEFDHFCVLVRIEMPGDANPSNNHAQNNFGNVQTVFGKPFSIKLLVPNPTQIEARGALLARGLPEEWRPRFEGVPDTKGFALKPREFRVVTLTFQPPPVRGEEAKPIRQQVDLSLQVGGKMVGGVSFETTVSKALPILFPPAGGVLSPYIIGTWDMREGRATMLQLVNPTGQYLYLWVAFFDDNEKPLKCVRERLSPNDLLELDVRRVVEKGYGVAKVVAFSTGDFTRPTAGVVGYQRQFIKDGSFSEAPLHTIPVEILKGDFRFIQAACK
jgi:hypothetical protein